MARRAAPCSATAAAATPIPWRRCSSFFPAATSPPPWPAALALAISHQPARIGLWGVNCDDKEEYLEQRPCIEYLIGQAEARGIEVVIPASSPLCKSSFVYGEETNPTREAMLQRLRELQGRLNMAQLAEQQAHNDRVAIEAAIIELTYWKSRY